MSEQRLQKILAQAGVASRRAAEKMMRDGRVTVNGRVVTRMGTHADPSRDHIKVDGKAIRRPSGQCQYFVAFKPTGMLTTLSDPEDRPTVADLLRAHRIRRRVFPVGRLDWDADGLLLLTDDGDLAHRVTHPKHHLTKVYRVKVKGHPNAKAIQRLRRGVPIDGATRSLPAEVRVEREGEGTTWLHVTLREGRQNQLKKMFLHVGHPVRKIRRIAVGPLRLGRLRRGQVRRLTDLELRRLRAALSLDPSH